LPVAALVTLSGVERAGVTEAPRDVTGAVAERVGEGYRTVKFKMGGAAGFEAELAELVAVRLSFPYLRMRVDVNGCWAVDDARDRMERLQRGVAPEFVEQPVGAAELLDLPRMPVPLAADETMRLPGAVARLAEGLGCAAVVLKPMLLGGLRACLAAGWPGGRRGWWRRPG
jgi:L-alanine-DL-glutamate epimerase-like enolase superfamily enzyme